jgi:hypothetical protein
MSSAELNGQPDRQSSMTSIFDFMQIFLEWLFESVDLGVSHVLWDYGPVELFTRHEAECHHRFT